MSTESLPSRRAKTVTHLRSVLESIYGLSILASRIAPKLGICLLSSSVGKTVMDMKLHVVSNPPSGATVTKHHSHMMDPTKHQFLSTMSPQYRQQSRCSQTYTAPPLTHPIRPGLGATSPLSQTLSSAPSTNSITPPSTMTSS